MDMRAFAINAINSNPDVKNSPMAQQFLQALQSGNNQQGEAMANNILQTYGLKREEAMQQATNGLRSMFHF